MICDLGILVFLMFFSLESFVCLDAFSKQEAFADKECETFFSYWQEGEPTCPCLCGGAIAWGRSGCDGAWRSAPRVLGRTASEARLEEMARDAGRAAGGPVPAGGPWSPFPPGASSSPSESTIKTYSALKRSLCCIPWGFFSLNSFPWEALSSTSEGQVRAPCSLSCWCPTFKVKYSLESNCNKWRNRKELMLLW